MPIDTTLTHEMPFQEAGPNGPIPGGQENAETQETPDTPPKSGDLGVPTAEATDAPTEEGARPEWLPKKFKTPADMARAYADLERKQSTPKAPDAAKPKDAPAEPAPSGPLDLTKYTAEFTDAGTLSDASYTELEQKGLPRAVVDAYIDGLRAKGESIVSTAHAELGGSEQYAAMVEWAKTNVDKGELDVFNAAVKSGDPAQTMFAIRGLKAQFAAAGGARFQPPQRRLTGRPGAASGGEAYGSQAEVTADMSTYKYKNDPAERARVMTKLARSDIKT